MNKASYDHDPKEGSLTSAKPTSFIDAPLKERCGLVSDLIRTVRRTTPTVEFFILVTLTHRDGEMKLSELYRIAFTSSAMTRRHLRNLESANFVITTPNEADKRECIIRITDVGIAQIRSLLSRTLIGGSNLQGCGAGDDD